MYEYRIMLLLRRAGFYTLSSLVLLLGVIACREHVVDMYHIPSGSMRPTLVEDDYVVVRKSVKPETIERKALIIFQHNGERCVKRLIGKPGDTLYFYGGRIYGIDKDGQELSFTDLKQDYVPFASFEGTLGTEQDLEGKVTSVCFKQMGLSLGRLAFTNTGGAKTTSLRNGAYGDFVGINNFALARIVTDKEVGRSQTVYYLELRHSPSLTSPPPQFVAADDGLMRLEIGAKKSFIPLRPDQVDALGGVTVFNAESRHAYFRNGDLLVAGYTLFTGKSAIEDFVDRGIPDKYLIRTQGVTIPSDHYLVLGDNPSQSADSRDFGFIPASAIQGVVVTVI